MLQAGAYKVQGSRDSYTLPIVSIVVPFFGYPVLWLGSYNRDVG